MKNSSLFVPVLCLATILITGCTTVGNKNLDDVGSYLGFKQGVSTKNDIYGVFGQPANVVYQKVVPGPCIWTYVKSQQHLSAWTFVPYVGILAGGQSQDTTKAYFTFDAAGRYTEIHTDKDSHYVNSWVGLGQAIAGRSRDQVQRVHDEMDRLGKPFNLKQATIQGEVRYVTVPQRQP